MVISAQWRKGKGKKRLPGGERSTTKRLSKRARWGLMRQNAKSDQFDETYFSRRTLRIENPFSVKKAVASSIMVGLPQR